MTKNRRLFLTAGFCMLLLIMDAQTAIKGAQDGIHQVLYTVIPALFPFMITTSVLNQVLIGQHLPGLRGIRKACGLPYGAESVWILGLISGYPIGAKLIADAYKAGQLERRTAQRLLGFCSNAGPAFVFGIIGQMFSNRIVPFVIAGIHILSALLTGLILPAKENCHCTVIRKTKFSLPQIVENSVKTLSLICAWIILWRIIISFLYKYILFQTPACLNVILIGVCELTNGCIALNTIKNEAVRCIVASCLLAGGGICVAMQTKSVTESLGITTYFTGKLLQVIISFVLSAAVCYALYPSFLPLPFLFALLIGILCIIGIAFILKRSENNGSNSAKYVI